MCKEWLEGKGKWKLPLALLRVYTAFWGTDLPSRYTQNFLSLCCFPMCVRVVFGFITVLVIVVVVVVAAVFSNTIIAPALPGSTIVCT